MGFSKNLTANLGFPEFSKWSISTESYQWENCLTAICALLKLLSLVVVILMTFPWHQCSCFDYQNWNNHSLAFLDKRQLCLRPFITWKMKKNEKWPKRFRRQRAQQITCLASDALPRTGGKHILVSRAVRGLWCHPPQDCKLWAVSGRLAPSV